MQQKTNEYVSRRSYSRPFAGYLRLEILQAGISPTGNKFLQAFQRAPSNVTSIWSPIFSLVTGLSYLRRTMNVYSIS